MKVLGRIEPQPPKGIKYMLGNQTWLPAHERDLIRLHCEEWGNLGPMEAPDLALALEALDSLHRSACEHHAVARMGEYDVLSAALTRGVASAPSRKATDEEIQVWADRHGLGISSINTLREIFEDAQTLHMTFGVDACEGRGNV